MKKTTTFITFALLILVSILLTGFAPDMVSMATLLVMALVVVLGLVFGLWKLSLFVESLERARTKIAEASEIEAESTWKVLSSVESLFENSILDEVFRKYTEKTSTQQSNHQILSDIEDYFNDETLGLAAYETIVKEIPGTLTGLGIFGTFVGLVLGISHINFASVSHTMTSIRTLLDGINIAFYTSISGVILSILFNLIHKYFWNQMLRTLDLFVGDFHEQVVPTVEEQQRYLERREIKRIISLLGEKKESKRPVVVSQVSEDLSEFFWVVQPVFRLKSKEIVGGNVLVRWNHPQLGEVLPSSFLSDMEESGFVAKLDQKIWREVFAEIHRRGTVLPLSVVISKTDILALDVGKIWKDLLLEYPILPKFLSARIEESAYLEAPGETAKTEKSLLSMGFGVMLNHFCGDYVALDKAGEFLVDKFQINARSLSEEKREEIFYYGNHLRKSIVSTGIQNMKDLVDLQRFGCELGSGNYLARPMKPAEYFEL